MAQNGEASWFEDYAEEADDIQVEEYDITAAPNDFNVLTIFNFLSSRRSSDSWFSERITSGVSRACIQTNQSLILGLPVPQIFLYELERNRFVVIDGQQRLMSIYYFIKQRFPRKDKRTDLKVPPQTNTICG